MRIDIWSDYACPFCYIGKNRLEDALSKFPNCDKVEVVFRSFQLDPYAKVYNDQSIYDLVVTKYNMSYEKVVAMHGQLTEQAAQVGIEFNFDTVQPTNTFDSHRLSHYAIAKGKGEEITELLLQGYFKDALNIGDHSTLVSIAARVGLDEAEVAEMLKSEAYKDEVNRDLAEARQLNITGVPFFVFNNKYAVSGAQPEAVFTEVLNTVWAEDHPSPAFQMIGKDDSAGSDDAHCADGSCSV